MPKNVFFYKKTVKIAAALRSTPESVLLFLYNVITFYKRTILVLARLIITSNMRLISISNSTVKFLLVARNFFFPAHRVL